MDSSFWQSFWPNFWADLFVGIIIAGIISWILERSKKIGATIEVNTAVLNETEIQLTFSLKNTGRIAFNKEEIYWHVFVENSLKPKTTKIYNDTIPEELVITMWNKAFIDFKNILRLPVFPGRRVNLFDIKIQSSKTNKVEYYFFLSTAHGLFPKTAKMDNAGNIIINTLGKVIKAS